MLVSLRRFKMVLPPFPPHLMIRYQSRHLESTLNQFISFVFNHPPRFELSTIRRRRHRREEVKEDERKKLLTSRSWKYFSSNGSLSLRLHHPLHLD